LGDAIISIDIDLVGPEITACTQASPLLPTAITEDAFDLELPDSARGGTLRSDYVSVMMDNTLSPAHTLVQIMCQDHKGLLYDIMRTLKDYNIQVQKFEIFIILQFLELILCCYKLICQQTLDSISS